MRLSAPHRTIPETTSRASILSIVTTNRTKETDRVLTGPSSYVQVVGKVHVVGVLVVELLVKHFGQIQLASLALLANHLLGQVATIHPLRLHNVLGEILALTPGFPLTGSRPTYSLFPALLQRLTCLEQHLFVLSVGASRVFVPDFIPVIALILVFNTNVIEQIVSFQAIDPVPLDHFPCFLIHYSHCTRELFDSLGRPCDFLPLLLCHNTPTLIIFIISY